MRFLKKFSPLFICISIVFITLLNFSKGDNAMLMEDKFLSSVFPQGYGFFTRKPKEDHLHIYKKINNNYELLTVNNSTGERFYGASRKTAKILLDLSFISVKIKEWENFDDWENISEKWIEL